MNKHLSQALSNLIFDALDQGVAIARKGDPIIPFLLSERGGKRSLYRFAADPIHEGVEMAQRALAKAPADVTAYALVFDGYITEGAAKRLPCRRARLAWLYLFLARLRRPTPHMVDSGPGTVGRAGLDRLTSHEQAMAAPVKATVEKRRTKWSMDRSAKE